MRSSNDYKTCDYQSRCVLTLGHVGVHTNDGYHQGRLAALKECLTISDSFVSAAQAAEVIRALLQTEIDK